MTNTLRRLCSGRAVRPLGFAIGCAWAALAGAADAPPGYEIQCLEEPQSKKQWCFAPSKLKVEGTSRSSPLYTGTGTDLAMTKLVAAADCRKSTIVLQDPTGAAAKGQAPLRTDVAKALAADMCAVKVAAAAKTPAAQSAPPAKVAAPAKAAPAAASPSPKP